MNITTAPWVYIFSKFTSEALLFEALMIFTLVAVYTGFWLLRKRRFGVIKKEVPAGVVKYYLNELIGDAELLRAQLFGLLYGQGIPATPLAGLNFGQPGMAAPAGAPQSTAALGALEAKIAEQAAQIQNYLGEKTRIEQELAAARAAKGGAPAGDNSDLKNKINQLEGKLAEYSVIEDDLANLKRLQQENAALKAQLSGKPAPAVAATPAPEAPAPVAAAVPEAPAPVAAAPEPVAAASTPTDINAAAAQAAAAPADAAIFEGLVDKVEESLQAAPAAPAPTAPVAGASAPAGATAAAATPVAPTPSVTAAPAPVAAAAETSSTPANPAATIDSSDADLVAEFEKMLNG